MTPRSRRSRRQCGPESDPVPIRCQSGANFGFCSFGEVVLSPWPRSDGEVPERSNGAVSKTVVLLAGDRGFESLPLRHPKQLILLNYKSLHGNRNTPEFPGFSSGGSGVVVRRDRLSDGRTGPNPASVSVWRLLQYGLKKTADAELAKSRTRQAVSRPRSGEAENAALLRPSEWQAGMSEQLLRGEGARVAAVEDRPRDVGSQVGQPQHPGEVGACQTLGLCNISEILTAALGELTVEEMRPGDQLDQLGIGCCRP